MIYRDLMGQPSKVDAALNDIAGQQINSRFALKLRKLKRRVTELAEDANGVLEQLRKRHAKVDEHGQPITKDGQIVPADRTAFDADVDELLATPVDGIELLSLDDLAGIALRGASWASPILSTDDAPTFGTVPLKRRMIYGNGPEARAVRDFASRQLPQEVGLYVRALLTVVDAEIDATRKAHLALLDQYGQHGADGALIEHDGVFEINDRPMFDKAYQVLMDEEFTAPVVSFTVLADSGIEFAGDTWLSPFVAD